MRRESWNDNRERERERQEGGTKRTRREGRWAKGGSDDEFEIQKRQLPRRQRRGLLSRRDLGSLLLYRSCLPPLYKSVNCLETNLEEYNRYIPIPDSLYIPFGSVVAWRLLLDYLNAIRRHRRYILYIELSDVFRIHVEYIYKINFLSNHEL